jgi:hypothetical protein
MAKQGEECPSRTELLIIYVRYLKSPRGGGGRRDAPPKIHIVAFARVRNKRSGRRHSTSMIKRTKYCFSKYQGSKPKHTTNQVAELRSAELLTSYYNKMDICLHLFTSVYFCLHLFTFVYICLVLFTSLVKWNKKVFHGHVWNKKVFHSLV